MNSSNPISHTRCVSVCIVVVGVFYIYMGHNGWNFTDKHNFSLQHLRESFAFMHYSPTLRRILAQAVCTQTLAKGVHRGISGDPRYPKDGQPLFYPFAQREEVVLRMEYIYILVIGRISAIRLCEQYQFWGIMMS